MTAVPVSAAAFTIMPTKETAACCIAARDALGRPPIGFCGPGCLRAMARRLLAEYHARLLSAEREWYGEPWHLSHYEPKDRFDKRGPWEPLADQWDDPTSAAVVG